MTWLRGDVQARARALEEYERVTELPLLLLAVAMIPLILLPLTVSLSSAVDNALLTTDWTIWGIFGADLVLRTYLSERRVNYLVTHWFDVLIVAVPFLRPLRIARSARAFRLLRASRLLGFAARAVDASREIGRRNGLAFVIVIAICLIFLSALIVFAFERSSEGSIDNYGTALWWAVTTITTVGYGDAVPVTPEGRGIAVFLMIVGISLFGFLTANIAAFLVEQESETSLDDVMAKLESIERQMELLRHDMDERRVGGDPS